MSFPRAPEQLRGTMGTVTWAQGLPQSTGVSASQRSPRIAAEPGLGGRVTTHTRGRGRQLACLSTSHLALFPFPTPSRRSQALEFLSFPRPGANQEAEASKSRKLVAPEGSGAPGLCAPGFRPGSQNHPARQRKAGCPQSPLTDSRMVTLGWGVECQQPETSPRPAGWGLEQHAVFSGLGIQVG